MDIKKIDQEKMNTAISLILSVFMEFKATDCSTEGIENFKKTALYNSQFMNSLEIYGAYNENDLLGIIATRNEGNHIALFFVDGKYHRQGIGKKLFSTVLKNSTANNITVNSSPYAVKIYQRLGFVPTSPELIKNGIRYTPMIYNKMN